MPRFSSRSKQALATCHHDLRRVFNRVIETVDCTILEGMRNRGQQDEAFASGQSKVEWPDSYHNRLPSEATDAAPWPIDWDTEKALLEAARAGDLTEITRITHIIQRWMMFIGFVRGVAAEMGIELVSGADWDGDFDLADQNFDDWPHFQLKRN